MLKYRYHDGTHTWFAEFYGLRHTGITMIVRKAGLRVGQAWGDYSTPVLTAKYAHVSPGEISEALTTGVADWQETVAGVGGNGL